MKEKKLVEETEEIVEEKLEKTTDLNDKLIDAIDEEFPETESESKEEIAAVAEAINEEKQEETKPEDENHVEDEVEEQEEIEKLDAQEELTKGEDNKEDVSEKVEENLDTEKDEPSNNEEMYSFEEEETTEPVTEDKKTATLEDIVKNDYQERTMVNMASLTPNIGIASDHRGFKLKQKLTKYLIKKGYNVVDYGCDDKHSCDYPEFGFKLGEAVRDGKVEKGIAICGSGIGISIACNKVKGVRCAKVNNVKEAKYTRLDNDANIVALNGNMPTFRAKDIIDVFLKTTFSGKERHQNRINMLDEYK